MPKLRLRSIAFEVFLPYGCCERLCLVYTQQWTVDAYVKRTLDMPLLYCAGAQFRRKIRMVFEGKLKAEKPFCNPDRVDRTEIAQAFLADQLFQRANCNIDRPVVHSQ